MEYEASKYNFEAKNILQKRYLLPGEQSPEDMFRRVAKAIAAVECTRGPEEFQFADSWENKFFELMNSLKFLPNSPTLMNAGTDNQQLSACFVLPVEDKMESIFDAVKHTALIHKSGGGTGFSFSRLRGKNSTVQSTKGVASGPLSFMTVFDAATDTVKQGGKRRGANMGMLHVDHPDILDFIDAKRDTNKLNNFNISVGITNKFMLATRKHTPPYGTPEVWNKLVKAAWETGEPGVVFLDYINSHNPTKHEAEIEATNPCGEQPLLPYESCILGSLNLIKFIKKLDTPVNTYEIDYDALKYAVHVAVRFLDNAIDVSDYPLPEIEEATKATRKIGLGVMGFADLLIKMNTSYDSLKALDIAKNIMEYINKEAAFASANLAKGNQHKKVYSSGHKNATRTTIAPTGTLSLIAGVSSGIEPVYATSYKRVINDKLTFDIRHPEADHPAFQTAHDIHWKWHVRMQAAFQKHVNNAVSKTINLPEDATVEDVSKAMMMAWELGCKGITVYRDGSRTGQVLQSNPPSTPKPTSVTPTQTPRPEIVGGKTRKIQTGCGNLYVTINGQDKPCELFASIGKAGGCAASQTEAIGRLVSLALRCGIEPYAIQQQLTGVRCSSPTREVVSCADGVALALSELKEGAIVEKEKQSTANILAGVCPQCGGNLIRQEGCARCSCGYERC